jgi:hypothetical protein
LELPPIAAATFSIGQIIAECDIQLMKTVLYSADALNALFGRRPERLA